MAIKNVSDGIKLGRAWWMTIIRPLTEGNGGWGMNVSDAIVSPDIIEECRYPSIFGGDYNEGNAGGSLNFAGYAGCLYLSTANQEIVNGGRLNNSYGGPGQVRLSEVQLSPRLGNTAVSSSTYFHGITTAARFQNTVGSVNGYGVGITLGAINSRDSAQISSVQQATDTDRLDLWANDGGTLVNALSIHTTGKAVTPGDTDNAFSLGRSDRRWKTVFAITGAINTSDERDKQQQREINSAEKLCAIELKDSIKAYKWDDAVEAKADGARWHFGLMAQRVVEVFEKHDLNAHEYGMLCYDEWEAEYSADGDVIKEAGNRYGVRYDEIIMFILASS